MSSRPRQAGQTTPVRLERLWERQIEHGSSARGGHFPVSLRDGYDGELQVNLHRQRPTVIANFVSTLDGVVALDADGSSGGGEVSGFFDPDRFVMGLLRSLADVVLVGAGTVRAAPTHEWTARRVHPASSKTYAAWRRRIGIPSAQPMTIVATARGQLDPRHPGLSAADVPVIIATTKVGAKKLNGAPLAANASVRKAGTGKTLTAAGLIEIASSIGARLILCEGGPHLIGDFVKAGLLDELFLTIAPQIAGRDDRQARLGFVEGAAFSIAGAPWGELISVRRASDYLFLRYRFATGLR